MPESKDQPVKQEDRQISINVKFIALNIGKREIRLTTEEAVQLRDALTKLLSATSQQVK